MGRVRCQEALGAERNICPQCAVRIVAALGVGSSGRGRDSGRGGGGSICYPYVLGLSCISRIRVMHMVDSRSEQGTKAHIGAAGQDIGLETVVCSAFHRLKGKRKKKLPR